MTQLMPKQMTVWTVLMVGICATWSLVLAAMASFLLWGLRGQPKDTRPRPMFHEWAPSDWGYGWRPMPSYRNSTGVWLEIDVTSNIVVVFATGDAGGEWGFNDIRPDYAVLRQTTPYEVTVQNAPDTLVWVGSAVREQLRMSPGTASRISKVLRADSTGEATADLLHTLLRNYEGPDEVKLSALVNAYDGG